MTGLATLEESQALYDSITAARGNNPGAPGPPSTPPDPNPPELNPPYDTTTLAGHEQLWQDVLKRRASLEAARLAAPVVQLYDGDYTLRGEVVGWRSVDFEFIENDTGIATIQLSLSHYLAQWAMNFQGRAKRNVHVTIDKQGARWSGIMDHYRVVVTKEGDAYLEIIFKHDFEQAKHILCWCNPFLIPEVQFPKLWVIFGPAKWCLLLTLFVNILRLETSLWTLPDNPLDIMEWAPLSFDPSGWRNIVKPFPLVDDNSNLTIVFSRFQPFFDLAKPILADAELTVTCRRYLPSQGDPHPFTDVAGPLGLTGTLQEIADQLLALIPLREGCLVWDIIDNSAFGTQTAFGGSILTGFIRAVLQISDNGFTEGVDIFTGDATFPGEYYTPKFLGTSPMAPWVVYDQSTPLNGVQTSEFIYYEATDTSFLTGGKSMPGVNEGISAGINMAGDFVTSLINSSLAPGGAFGSAIDLPPLGGIMDAIAKIFYEDTFMAFEEVPTLRAAGLTLPIAGLENVVTGLGDFHLHEGWGTPADRAFTLAAQMSIRAKEYSTRQHSTHKITVSDAAPYLIGDQGFGNFWLGNRIGTTVLNYPIPDTIFVERVTNIKYTWDKDGSKGWQLQVGYQEPEDPALKALTYIRQINGALGTLGIL